ncbi:Tr-type G domain-containing protein [Aphelenchoides fujianensis]|nr:Tr-type G domain-containing protein [Aphelenchoides fujianensis]
MTLAEGAIALDDSEAAVLDILADIDASLRLSDDDQIEKKHLIQLATVYDARPRFVARPSEEKVLKELAKEQQDLFSPVTFLDTPGHAAFKEMRARGARATDIVVLVVAADDGAKDQTVESIKYANEAGVPIVVAINKCDKPAADPVRTRRSLMEHGVVVEDMGGEVQVVEISALQGTNIDALQEALVMQAEYMELKSTPKGPVEGVVIEATTTPRPGEGVHDDRQARGPCGTGRTWGKVRSMQDEFGKTVREAGPSTPDGEDDLPSPGELILEVPEGESRAQSIVKLRAEREAAKQAEKEQDVIEAKREADRQLYEHNRELKFNKGIRFGSTLRNVHHKVHKHTKERTEDALPTVRLILRTDVDGTLEAIQNVLDTYNCPEVDLQLVDAAVGAPIEGDPIIYCFNLPISAGVRRLAAEKQVEIEQFNVIYRLVDALKERLDRTYGPTVERQLIGEGHVLKQFLITDRQRKKLPIAGTLGGEVVYEGKIESLKHENEFVAEAKINTEVGTVGDKSIRFKEDDAVEVYEEVTVQRHVEWNPPGF